VVVGRVVVVVDGRVLDVVGRVVEVELVVELDGGAVVVVPARRSTTPWPPPSVTLVTAAPSTRRNVPPSWTVAELAPGWFTITRPPWNSRWNTSPDRVGAPRGSPKSTSYPAHQLSGSVPGALPP
jgi:hypothetical protein